MERVYVQCLQCSGRVPQAFESQLAWSHPPLRSASSRAFRRVIRSRLEASLIGPALSTRRSIRASTSSSGYASRASSTRSRTFSHAKTDGGMDVVPFSSCSAFRVKRISRRIFASATIRGSSVGVGDGVGGGGWGWRWRWCRPRSWRWRWRWSYRRRLHLKCTNVTPPVLYSIKPGPALIVNLRRLKIVEIEVLG